MLDTGTDHVPGRELFDPAGMPGDFVMSVFGIRNGHRQGLRALNSVADLPRRWILPKVGVL